MKIVRTIVWVLLLVAFLLFAFANWDQDVTVEIWDNLVWDTKLPAVVVIAFLLGALPMWLLHQATKWQLHRRIGSLQTAARAAAVPPPVTTPPAPAPATRGDAAAPAAAPVNKEPRPNYPPVDQHHPKP